jgi:formamidopyrimidine-DNA glycosylase
MPELPDLEAYLAALRERVLDRRLRSIRITSPFVLRSVSPRPVELEGASIRELRRLGKRLVIGLEEELFIVLHLMIAGRLHWRPPGTRVPRRSGLVAFDFSSGTLMVTEAGSKRRVALHLARGEEALALHDPGGLEILDCDLGEFRHRLRRERHTLKRSLTDPRIFSGIGNAYSDEILHAARLSPFKLSTELSPEEVGRLFAAARATVLQWAQRLRAEMGDGFPARVTAFRAGMAVHGRFNHPCPVCGAPVQRIVHADNEANYCPGCQTAGRIFSDRLRSRLLKDTWPRHLDLLER